MPELGVHPKNFLPAFSRLRDESIAFQLLQSVCDGGPTDAGFHQILGADRLPRAAHSFQRAEEVTGQVDFPGALAAGQVSFDSEFVAAIGAASFDPDFRFRRDVEV